MTNLADRSASEVFDDHLRLAQQGRWEEDIQRNFAPDCLALTGRGAYHRRTGIRTLYRILGEEIPEGRFCYRHRLVEGRAALLEWTVDTGAVRVPDGVDSFVIEHGHIQIQTIHYSLAPGPARAAP